MMKRVLIVFSLIFTLFFMISCHSEDDEDNQEVKSDSDRASNDTEKVVKIDDDSTAPLADGG